MEWNCSVSVCIPPQLSINPFYDNGVTFDPNDTRKRSEINETTETSIGTSAGEMLNEGDDDDTGYADAMADDEDDASPEA